MYFQELYEQMQKKESDNILYIPPMPKFSTYTPVTMETFLAWRRKFDQEQYEIKKRQRQFVEKEELMNKISGKHFFMEKKKQGERRGEEEEEKLDDEDALEIDNYQEEQEEEEDENMNVTLHSLTFSSTATTRKTTTKKLSDLC